LASYSCSVELLQRGKGLTQARSYFFRVFAAFLAERERAAAERFAAAL
jgi:hypothetical protein